MAQNLRTGERQGYAAELAGVWSGLARTLARLDALAAAPEDELDADDAALQLARLRYALHVASEHVHGLTPPAGAAGRHGELADALEDARDATAEVAEAVELGGAPAAAEFVPEWRVALFRVRLARLQLAGGRARRPAEPEGPRTLGLALGLASTLVGAAALAIGTSISFWPVWAAGIVAVAGGLLAQRA